MADSDVTLVAEAIGTVFEQTIGIVHLATLERAARAVLGALAGAERLRAEDSGVEVQLRARWVELQGEASKMGAMRGGKTVLTAHVAEVLHLAERLGIDLG